MIPVSDTEGALPVDDPGALAEDASALGFEVVDVAGFLEHVAGVAQAQLGDIGAAEGAARRAQSENAAVQASADDVAGTVRTSLSAAEASAERVRAAIAGTAALADWVSELTERLRTVDAALLAIRKANAEIASIATQVNMLAINAKIEAAHAGPAGRGFAVVADSINELSRKTARTADGIGTAVGDLTAWSRAVTGETDDLKGKVDALVAGADVTDAAMGEIAGGLSAALSGTATIAEAAARSERAMGDFVTAFAAIGEGTRSTADAVARARDRADAMIDRSERIVQRTASRGGGTADARFIERVIADARRLSDALEAAVGAGRIAMPDLFSEVYRPVPGSDPPRSWRPSPS